ncbi:MAG: transporter substrate-binding domain-containing protein [Rhizobiaceae bacterium]|nr:transporter substrate-binding domain-containing protein [Rhizobiaceae bacterium]
MNFLRLGILAALTSLPIITSTAAADVPSFAAEGRLVACIDPTFPPLEFMESTEAERPVGFDVDMLDALAEEWGAKTELVMLEFSGLLPSLEAKRCDIMASGAVMNEERMQKFGGTPYLNTGYIIIGKGDTPGSYESYEDFGGEKIAVQSGSLLEKVLDKANKQLEEDGKELIAIQPYPKATAVIQQVLIGRVIGGTSLDTEFAFRDMQKPGELKVLFADPEKQQYTAYYRKTPEGDQAIVDATVQKLISSGKLKEIATKWNLRPDAFEDIGS